jgi:ComF family protein
MRLTTIHLKKLLRTITTIGVAARSRPEWKILKSLWRFAGLLLFETPTCLLCQVELALETTQSTREDVFGHLLQSNPFSQSNLLPQSNSQEQLVSLAQSAPESRSDSICQVVDQKSMLARAVKLSEFARARLCSECMTFLFDLTEVKTTLIGDDDGSPMSCFSSGFYNGLLQEAIYQIKYLKRPELARALAFTMLPPTVALLKTIEATDICHPAKMTRAVIVPVPLHKNKLKERGFNQAEELATGLSKLLSLKVDSQSLKRIRPTRPQFGLSRRQRRLNLEGAFAASKALSGKEVLLVDDVLTSGATLYECSRAIEAVGGTVVGAITLARARWQQRGQRDESAVVPAISLVF